jgi:ADP-ribosyl-[dinitrogen reductase] hydrolase
MRAAPIGIYPTISLVIERCQLQAALTHTMPNGINAAVAAALMTHYFLYHLGPKKELGIFLEQYVSGRWATPYLNLHRCKRSQNGEKCTHVLY